jgi:hypothetical protein
MRKGRSVCVALVSIVVSLSGCFASDGDAGFKGQVAGDGAGDGNQTSNQTIQAVIVVLIDGTETQIDNGTLGTIAGTNLTFDGSRSIGENLTYAWDFGDETTGSNATEVHAFAEPGLYMVALDVASGNATSSATLAINVTAAGPKPGELVWTDKKTFSGSLTIGNPNAANLPEYDHRDHTVAIVAADPDGTPAMAKKVKIVLDGSGAAALDMYVYWRGPTGTNLATASGAGPDKTLTYEGAMAPGNYVVRVRFATGAMATYTVKADVDYFAT